MRGYEELEVPYSHVGGRTRMLSITRPVGRGCGRFPTLLDFHGGAWTHFEPRVDLAWCRELARAGVLTASVEFRLAPEHPWPAFLADARAALRWITAHGGEVGADATRLGTIGGSTGGFLSILLALCPRGEDETPTPALDTPDDLPPAAPRVAVGFYPILDVVGRYRMVRDARFSRTTRMLRERIGPRRRAAGHHLKAPMARLERLHALKSWGGGLGRAAGTAVNRALAAASSLDFLRLAVFEELAANHEGAFGSIEEMHAASPLARVEEGRIQAKPAILVIQGREDINLTAAMSERFAAAYGRAGGEISLVLEPGFPHAFASIPSRQSDRAIERTLAFLTAHSLLPPAA